MPDTTGFVVAAYVVTWVALLGYLARVRALARRAHALNSQADAAGAKS